MFKKSKILIIVIIQPPAAEPCFKHEDLSVCVFVDVSHTFMFTHRGILYMFSLRQISKPHFLWINQIDAVMAAGLFQSSQFTEEAEKCLGACDDTERTWWCSCFQPEPHISFCGNVLCSHSHQETHLIQR